MLLPAALVLLRDAVLDPCADGLGRVAAVLVLAVLGLWALLLERLPQLTTAGYVRRRWALRS